MAARIRLSAASVAATEWFQSSPSSRPYAGIGARNRSRTFTPRARATTGPAPIRTTASFTVVISLRDALHEEFARRSSAAVSAWS